ncbi:hypothetical protein ACFQ6N_00640 [Kitasatospora sp. NPDC056446]|uniref:hypothetical protein n=1 Tax=Kitasatospora sp. NPDC056446 TaxID=3345819 RepID=UPI00367683AC
MASQSKRVVGGLGDDLGVLVMRGDAVRPTKRPSNPVISARVANLRQGGFLLLERVEEEPGDWYVQVRMREDNTFQLEHRDGVPAEHYLTRTVSRDRVVAAMVGWAVGDPGWRDSFMWNNIGSCFEHHGARDD